ncbi:uncharacterized protein LOC105827868 isoform X1 [Monomorium pharaonis]|uniref:uncharacterized protein LOC105827868 isoform X1 n=1 Tax=Monomorium pharaonis TaxID=307658 RepID=UPI00174732CD|nr:uncharacterized protein LOC105827868 isoform X1 [Monomorium pharaonis]
MDPKKDKRSSNFTASDKQLLLRLCNEHKSIIECKKTDGCTWRKKDEMWKEIENLFNSSTTSIHRTVKQLKFKYEAIKRDLKKERVKNKAYTRGTGGGQYIPPPVTNTEEENELLQTIEISVEGLTNTFDCDGLSGNNSWHSRRRPVLHKASKSSVSAAFELLAEKKIQLVNWQIELEKIRRAHVRQKNQLEIDILNLQKDEMQLKVDLLKKH